MYASKPKFAYDHISERVKILKGKFKDETGTIRGREIHNDIYAVELDQVHEEAHPCEGLVKNGNGWWVLRTNFELIDPKEKGNCVGKRIKVLCAFRKGEEGYIKTYIPSLKAYAVEMDTYTPDTHDCGGLTKPNRGYWLKREEFEVIEDPFEKEEKPKTEEKEEKQGILIGDFVSFVHQNKTTYGTVYAYEPKSDVYGIRDANGDTYWVCADRVVYTETTAMGNVAEESNKHYAEGIIQPIEVMQENMTPEQFFGFLRGNLIKYLCRLGRKDEVTKETFKIKEYAEWLHQAACGEKITPRF